MGRVHDVLRWANRRAVAEEVTARGYRLSGETLNRWVRDEREFPAVVERIVFDLFTIGRDEKPPEPQWLEGLADGIAGKVISELTASRSDEMSRLVDDLEQRLAQRSEAPPVRTDTADQDG